MVAYTQRQCDCNFESVDFPFVLVNNVIKFCFIYEKMERF